MVYKQLNFTQFSVGLLYTVQVIMHKCRTYCEQNKVPRLFFFNLYRGFGPTGLITDRACGKDNAIGGVRPSICVLSVC